MDLILETDIGRDADDFFALLYLITAGVNIRCITISPGDLDQVTLVKTMLMECGLDIPVGVGKLDRDKSSVGGMHLDFLAKYGPKYLLDHDGLGSDMIADTMKKYPDCECLCIGPINSVGGYLRSGGTLGRLTMQGGFVGYDQHSEHVEILEKFIGQDMVSTFNLGGDKKGSLALLSDEVFERHSPRQFVGKNVCHTILYGHKVHEFITSEKPSCRAQELFFKGMDMYLAKQDFKAFHDPTAAVCHLHPETGKWMEGRLKYGGGKYGGFPCTPGDHLLIDINRDALWNHIKTPRIK